MQPFDSGNYAADYYVRHFLQSLTTLSGMIGVVGFLMLLILLVAFGKSRWFTLSLLLYICSLGYFISPWYQTKLLPVFEVLRNNSRSISGALLVALLIPTFMSNKGWRQRLFLAGTVGVFAFELLYCGRLLLGGLYVRAIVGAVMFGLTFLTFGVGLPQWLHDVRDAHSAVRAVAVAGGMFAVVTAIQLLINPSSVIWQNRLISTTDGATHTAEDIATFLPAVLFLVGSRDERRFMRIAWGALAGLLVILLVWTGTRTGLLMGVVGVGLLFRFRIGKVLGTALVVGSFALLVWAIWGQSTAGIDRLVWTGNTRSVTWNIAIQDFLTNPVYGVVDQKALITESSYLTVAAKMGMLGLLPLAFTMALIGRSLWQLQKIRRHLGEDMMLADLVTAGLVSLAIGGIFEGFLVAVLDPEVFTVYIYLAILAFILDRMHQAMATGELSAQSIETEPAFEYAGAEPSYS